jgi:hypothetical protein
MIIYKDIFTQDEMLSDTYRIETLYDGVIFKVKGKLTSESTQVDDSMFGGNASAEGEDAGDGCDANVATGIDVIMAQRMQETSFKKKAYMAHIKEYMSKLKKKIAEDTPDEEKKFTAGCSKFVKEVLGEFDEYCFYTGENGLDGSGMTALVKWEGESGAEPCIYYFKHGLVPEKV